MNPLITSTVAQQSPDQTVAGIGAPPSPKPSTPTVPGYELIRVLGQGGMGIVYEAMDTNLRRRVALKMLLIGGHGTLQERERLRMEAESVAKLQHPGIVQIYEIGECETGPYLSLEFVGGGSLASRLDGTPWQAQEAARMVEQLADAISVAHEQGIIHRDLKPGNILMAKAGYEIGDPKAETILAPDLPTASHSLALDRPKISDFGLAKKLDSQHSPTVTGAVLGTPSYMAPEQAEGKIHDIGPGSDVYSLGAILYELLTGKPPFVGATLLDTLDQVRKAEPVPPIRINPRIPRDLDTICLKCLQKDSKKRYRTSKELAEDLQRFLDNRPILARPVGPIERAWKWVKRNRTVTVALVGIFLIVAISVGVLTNAYLRTQRAKAALEANLYITYLSLAERELSVRNERRMTELLQKCPEPLRGWEWNVLNRLRCEKPVTFIDHEAVVTGTTISYDGKWVASAGEDHSIRIWSADTGREKLKIPIDINEQVYSVKFAPDGKRLVAGGQSFRVYLIDTETGKMTTLGSHDDVVVSVYYSPDGKTVASGSDDRTARIWDVNTGEELFRLEGHTDEVNSVAYRPDGKQLATASQDRTVRLWDLTTGKEIAKYEGHDGFVWTVNYSEGGRYLASGGADKMVNIWDTQTHQLVHQLKGHTGSVWSVVFSTEDCRVISGSWDKTIKIWDWKIERELVTLHGHTDSVTGLCFRNYRLVSGSDDGSIKVWDAAASCKMEIEPEVLFDSHHHIVRNCALSPDGELVASGGDGKKIFLWNSRTKEILHRIDAHPSGTTCLAFTPDGTKLVTGGQDKKAHVWDVKTGQLLQTFTRHRDRLTDLAISPDGTKVVSCAWEGIVRVWDLQTGKQLHELIGHLGWVAGVAWAPDGKAVVSGGNNRTIRMWNSETGKELHIWEGNPAPYFGLVFNRDNLLASATGDSKVLLWNLDRDQPVGVLAEHSQRVYRVGFDPSGTLLASASEDETVRIWDVKSGKQIAWFHPHHGPVNYVEFSKDGQRLITCSDDQTVKIWNVKKLMKEGVK